MISWAKIFLSLFRHLACKNKLNFERSHKCLISRGSRNWVKFKGLRNFKWRGYWTIILMGRGMDGRDCKAKSGYFFLLKLFSFFQAKSYFLDFWIHTYPLAIALSKKYLLKHLYAEILNVEIGKGVSIILIWFFQWGKVFFYSKN